MATGKYWRDDPYYFSAVHLDRDVPDEDDLPEWDEEEDLLDEEAEDGDPRDRDEDEDEDDDWEDMEDDTHDGGSHRASDSDTDWSESDEDIY